jgi:hypothetical protein
MHLVMKENGGNVNVIWDNYEGFFYNSYDLLRRTDNQNWTVIEPGITIADLPFYQDTPPTLNGLDYMIEIVPPGGTCTATEGKAQDYNTSRSNKPSSIFNPGEGTGDPNNGLAKEENENFTVALYPNPSNGLFKISMNHKVSNAKFKMDVVDLNGKTIHQNEVQNGVNYINLQNIDAGIYFVKLYDESNSETIRIMVK